MIMMPYHTTVLTLKSRVITVYQYIKGRSGQLRIYVNPYYTTVITLISRVKTVMIS